MKEGACFLNLSRGFVVDHEALAANLKAGKIAGAGLDVLSMEPPAGTNPLITARNCLVTPHIAWATKEARSRLMDTAVSNVADFVSGSPRNVVI